MTSDLTGCDMVYMVDDAVFGGVFHPVPPAFGGPAAPLVVRLPGLTVVGICDQQTLTNEGAIN